MKTILSSRKHHYLAIVSIFLIVLTLIAGVVGCGPIQYNLTISSTEGGHVTSPGEGVFTYDEGTVVNLVAEAEEGYYFVKWTGDVGTIDDINAVETTITMNSTYSITANFAISIEIWDWYDLHNVRDNLDGSYLLMNDLDSTNPGYINRASPTANGGEGWDPIGTSLNPFNGNFNGQGYEIRDLFIDRPVEDHVGLFGFVDEGGRIKDIGVTNVTMNGHFFVGGLVGWMRYGTVSNSYSTGNVQGYGDIGGLVGKNSGNVTNSSSNASVTSTSSPYGFSAGGLVGWMRYGTVSNSYATGSVFGNEWVGGLVGESNNSTVSNSFWDTETSGRATSDGGIGKTTTEMQDITTFSSAMWDIVAVANPGIRNPAYIWNIVNNVTYPFLSWQSVS